MTTETASRRRRALANNATGRLSWCDRCSSFHLRLGIAEVRIAPHELLTLLGDVERLVEEFEGPHEPHPRHRLEVRDRSLSLRLSCSELRALGELLTAGRSAATRHVLDEAVDTRPSVVH